jgi:acetyl esterase/lipase
MKGRRLPLAPLVRYGGHPDQVANLHLPADDGGPWPTVVLVHGGFWRDGWDRTLMTPLAHDLAARGYAAWNIEYRRVGQDGGWPATLDDVVAAVTVLDRLPSVDRRQVVAVGHSAGGQLALSLAARAQLSGVISLAGVCDLAQAHADGLGGGAVADFLGGRPRLAEDDDFEARLLEASPIERIPNVPQVLVHGDRDDVVPLSQSRAYAERARAADVDVELVELAGADHVDVVAVDHAAWQTVVAALARLLPTGSA